YRLADTKHLLVRAKLNGKGPYTFIMDTGAPALFITAGMAGTIGAKVGEQGGAVVDRVEFEGGAVVEKIQTRVEEPMQLRAMNSMGVAGSRIDGVLGYN